MSDGVVPKPYGKMIREIDFIRDLAKALGITYPIRRITIDVGIDDVVKINVESIMRDPHQGRRIAELLSEGFCLCKVSEEKTPIEPS